MNTVNNFLNIKKTKGFTLVELLIVIAIIAILAAIAIPQFAQFRQKAAASNAASALSSCAHELNASFADTGTQLTKVCNVGSSSTTLTLDPTTGTVAGLAGSFTVKGLVVTCTLTNNQVDCL